jgi:hypothetical protein
VTNQPTMFGYADCRTRQPALFDTDGPPALTAQCEQCGEYPERTPSGYLCCPKGHGKLLTESPAIEPATEPDTEDDDETVPAWSWPQEARRIAKRHAARDNWHGRRWHCRCGACRQARRDGFIPRERVEH